LPSGNSDQANIPTTSTNTPAKQKRADPEQFIGLPGGGIKMHHERTAYGCHFAAQKRKRTKLRLIATSSSSKDNEEVDRAIAQCLVSMSNGNKENMAIELPGAGASRSAIFKQHRRQGWIGSVRTG
jgi:hypothetical protein